MLECQVPRYQKTMPVSSNLQLEKRRKSKWKHFFSLRLPCSLVIITYYIGGSTSLLIGDCYIVRNPKSHRTTRTRGSKMFKDVYSLRSLGISQYDRGKG